jgi:flagellar hook-length control protein FliK
MQPATQTSVATLQVGPASTSTNQSPVPDVHTLAVSIATQSQSGTKQFDIRLDPPELGRVDVRLTVDASGKAQAHLAVDKPQTLELLQRDSGTLARALKDSGVQLNNNGLQFSLKGQSRQGNGSPQSRGRALAVSAVDTSAAAGTSSSTFSASISGVDIRV